MYLQSGHCIVLSQGFVCAFVAIFYSIAITRMMMNFIARIHVAFCVMKKLNEPFQRNFRVLISLVLVWLTGYCGFFIMPDHTKNMLFVLLCVH